MKTRLCKVLQGFSGVQMLLLIASLALFTAIAKYIVVYYSELLFTVILVPLAYLAGGITLFSTDSNKSSAFRTLFALLIWAFISALINERRGESLLANQADLGQIVILLFVCFPAGYLVDRNVVQNFLKWAGITTVAIVTLIDAAAILMAVSGNYVMLPFNGQYGLGIMPGYMRLAALCYPNSVGMIGMVAIVLAIYLYKKTENIIPRIGCVISILVIYIAIALANARTSEIALAIALGLIAFTLIFNTQLKRKVFLRWFISAFVALIIAIMSFGLNSLVLRGFNTIVAPQAAQASTGVTADMETTTSTSDVAATVVDRSIVNDIGSLNGRTDIWKAAFAEISKDKSILLFGTSAGLVETVIGNYELHLGRNLHNSFLQALFALGIPGLVLMLVFLAYVFHASIRVFFADSLPSHAEQVLPAALVAIVVLSCMESFLLIYPGTYFANMWFVFIAGFLCRLSEAPDVAKIV